MSGGQGVQRHIELYGAAATLFKILTGQIKAPDEVMIEGPANSGKSLPVGKALWAFLDMWPDGQILLIRKTRVSLNDSFLDTFENEVLWPDHPAVIGRSREHRTRYEHPNGGILRLAGFDQPRRLFSSQDHIIWVNEMTELSLDEWQSLHRGLRRPGGPGWHLLGGDCNPDYGEHWANQRFPEGHKALRKGRLRLCSRHEDNPSITRAYIRRLDNQLVGFQHDRLAKGLWRSAEGQAYPMFDQDFHLLTASLRWPEDPYGDEIHEGRATLEVRTGIEEDAVEERELVWFGASMDFGWDSPGSLSVWGMDRQKRAYQVAQVYRRMRTPEWWAERAAELYEEFSFRFLVCDSADSVGAIAYINDFLQKRGVPRIAVPVKKPKHKVHMFNHVRWALQKKEDGLAHVYLLRDNLRYGVDAHCKSHFQPCSTAQEIPRLVLAKVKETEKGSVPQEETDKGCADHGCFPAGTLVETWTGPVPICRVNPGDYVLTPNGWEEVVDAARTGRRRLVTVHHRLGDFRCTADHPIFVQGRGFVRADELRYGDLLACAQSAFDDSRSRGTPTQTQRTGATTITPQPSRDAACAYTDSSGRDTGAPYRKGGKFTTRTATASTAASGTCDSSRRGSTGNSTDASRMGSWRNANGGGDRSGGSAALKLRECARIASSTFSRSAQTIAHADPTDASRLVFERVVRVTTESATAEDVYNLTVEPTHVFFADGVLASNCDEMGYFLLHAWKKDLSKRTEERKYQPQVYDFLLEDAKSLMLKERRNGRIL